MNSTDITTYIEIAMFILALFGSVGAIYQWRQGNIMKRADIVRNLINVVREDKDVASVMSIIDLNEGFSYDGKFHLYETGRECLSNLSDDDFFNMIDKTLSHFSYICYLRYQKVLKKKDMKIFEYELKRLFDNMHMCNYLYSLYHWSKDIETTMSFDFLSNYAIKKRFLNKSFLSISSSKYTCFLRLYNTKRNNQKEYSFTN